MTSSGPQDEATRSGMQPNWEPFDVPLDVPLIVKIDEYDWPPLPVATDLRMGFVTEGRRTGETIVQWLVELDPPARLESGELVDSVWMSARHFGRDLDLLDDAYFDDDLHVVLQGPAVWRAKVRRADSPMR